MHQQLLGHEEERIGSIIVDAALKVHKVLGPGLLESIYETCLHYELNKRGLTCERQIALPIMYEHIVFEEGLRLDLLVENKIICELKATDEMRPVYTAQLMSHLKLARKRLGFLINFNVPLLKHGIKRIVV